MRQSIWHRSAPQYLLAGHIRTLTKVRIWGEICGGASHRHVVDRDGAPEAGQRRDLCKLVSRLGRSRCPCDICGAGRATPRTGGCVAFAMRLSPLDPAMPSLQATTAYAHFFAGRYDEALSWAGMALRQRPDFV